MSYFFWRGFASAEKTQQFPGAPSYYRPKQCISMGKSLNIRIHLYCLIPGIWVKLMTHVLMLEHFGRAVRIEHADFMGDPRDQCRGHLHGQHEQTHHQVGFLLLAVLLHHCIAPNITNPI